MMTYLFVRIRADGLLRRRMVYAVASIVAPLAFLAIFAVIGWLSWRNRSYRGKIDSQRNLVHLGEAARTLSHEIRNPLSAVLIQTGILRKLLPPERRDNLDIIDEETGRIRDLVDRIRDFLKHPSGNPSRIDIVELAHELGSRYSWNLSFEGDEKPQIARFDPDRLRSVMENLIRNALEASDPKAPIIVRFTRVRSHLQVSILDRGTGIPTGAAERLFDPFYTTKDRGSGIGLAISKRFIEAAGGALVLKPREHGGTEAKITLPAVDEGDA